MGRMTGSFVLYRQFFSIAYEALQTVFFQLRMRQGLVDVGSLGQCFTWCNGRSGFHQIRERLDKGLANGDWMTLFPHAVIRILPRYASDHAPIILNTCGAMDAGPKPFLFKSCWTREESSKGVVAWAWRGSIWGSVSYRLLNV